MTASFSFNTWNQSVQLGLAPTLPEQIAAAASAGYDYVGLDVPSLLAHEASGLSPYEVRGCLDGYGISCFELVPLVVSDDPETASMGLAQAVRLAPVLGARQVLTVVRSAVSEGTARKLGRCVTELSALGIGTAVEFLPSIEINSIDLACQLLDRVDHPDLGIVVDSWHFFAGPNTWASLDALPHERLAFVQFSDAAPALSDDVVHEYLHRRELPGEGVHDLGGFSERILRRWPDIVVSVEVLSSAWRTRPIRKFAAETLQSTRRFWEGTS